MNNSLHKSTRYVVLRDDDTNAWTDPDCLERLYRPFLDRDLPVNLAVIPAVTSDARRADGRREAFLGAGASLEGSGRAVGANNALCDYLHGNKGYHIVQHGYDHRFNEFASRERGDIQWRIDQGTARLEEAGFARPSAFVAPYDQISRAAYSALIGRFGVVSTGWFERSRIPLRWWPAYVRKKIRNAPHWMVGGTCLLSHPGCILSRFGDRSRMMADIRRVVSSQRLTVLVTHWWEYFPEGHPDEEMIAILQQTAEMLAADPEIRVVPLSTVASIAREDTSALQ